MELSTFNEIVSEIQQHHGLTKDCLILLQEKYPNINVGTLCSILSQEYQKKIKQSNYKNNKLHETLLTQYLELKKQNPAPGVLINLALSLELAPSLAARMILKQFYNEEENQLSVSSKRNINAMLKDTTLIDDGDLAYEIFLTTIYDDQYSPIAETIKHTVGQQYEIRLHKLLEKLGIAFRDEESLRKYGYDKTPDIKLEVPVAIDGFVVNWIESKALFGDDEQHRGYMKDQYLSYWNRFGSGMVIYWFGYLETIKDSSDKRFLIVDNVPENITYFSHSIRQESSS